MLRPAALAHEPEPDAARRGMLSPAAFSVKLRSRVKVILKLTLFAIIVSLLAAPGAFAYVDPGAGSILFQVLVGVVATLAASFWKGLKKFLLNPTKRTTDPPKNPRKENQD